MPCVPYEERPRLRFSREATSEWGRARRPAPARPTSPKRAAGEDAGRGGSRSASASASAEGDESAEGGSAVAAMPSTMGRCPSVLRRDLAQTVPKAEPEDEAATFEVEAERLQQAAARLGMQHPRVACWRPAACDAAPIIAAGGSFAAVESLGLSKAADEVLREGQALEEKEYLFKMMQREGAHSATRRVIAENVRNRLREARGADHKKVAGVYQRCTTIRNCLNEMKDARRELRAVRKSASAVLVGEEPTQSDWGMRAMLRGRFTEAISSPVQTVC